MTRMLFMCLLTAAMPLLGRCSVAMAQDAIDPQILRELGMPESAAQNELLATALRSALAKFDADLHRPTGVAPALDAELNALDRMRDGEKTDFAAVERLGEKMAEAYKAPVDKGRIYAMVTQVYGQSGCRPPTMAWAKKALEHPLEPRLALRMYLYWGDALSIKNFREIRKGVAKETAETALPYLMGIQMAQSYSLPEVKPELPGVSKVDLGPGDAQARRDHQRQVETRVIAQFVREMVEMRDILVRQLEEQVMQLDRPRQNQLRAALLNGPTIDRLVIAAQKDEGKGFAEAVEKLVADVAPPVKQN